MFFVVLGLMAVVLSIGSVALATNLSQSQQAAIVANCSSTKNTLNQLHVSDALLRVNMGQMYEAISTKLMDGFNNRVSNNGFNNSNLSGVSNSYDSQLDKFRSDYITYEDNLSTAINIDCKKNPTGFYDAVSTARNDRIKVHDDVVQLNKLIDEYGLRVNQFKDDYQKAGGN